MIHTHAHVTLLRFVALPSKKMDLIDLVAFAQGQIGGAVPPSWFAFAADVVDIFGAQQRWPEQRDAAPWLSR